MNMNDYKKILFNKCLEREIDNQEVRFLSETYENYAESIIPDLKQRNKLSDLRTSYGTACKEAGWHSGFHTAIQILKEFLL